MRFRLSTWLACLGLALFVMGAGMVGCGPAPQLEIPQADGVVGKDGGSETTKEGIPQPDKAKPEGGQTCQTTCDCPQSLACVNGTCVSSTAPVYCCSKRGCPVGSQCVTRTGSIGSCGDAGSLCNNTCDCIAGLGCLNGQCTKLAEPIYCCDRPKECPANAKCEDAQGQSRTCGGQPPACRTHCDCPQGQACTQGACGITDEVVYCCDKAGCPQDQACFKTDGTPGKCGNTPVQCRTDADCKAPTCSSQGANCIQVQEICQAGQCISRSNSIPNAQCIAGGKCVTTGGCKTHCDCPGTLGCLNGQCGNNGVSYFCCGDPQCPTGATCYNKDDSKGICGNTGGCQSDADCPKQTCRDSGTDCYEQQFACDTATGKCVGNPVPYRNSVCDQAKGNCVAKAPSCRLDCDCPQRQGCVNGTCTVTATPKYCCDNAGCPSGQACVDKTGKAGTCPAAPACSADADCGKAYCTQQGTDCLYKIPTCANAICTETSKTVPGQTCDTTSGTCKPACTSDSDCQKATCKQNGKLCDRSVGQCRNGQCQTSSTSIVGTCGANGVCTPATKCQSHCDCPQGDYCYQGQCIRSSYPVYCCDNPGCPAGYTCYGATSSTAQTCPTPCNSPCDCGEGEDCRNGICSKQSLGGPVYCCDNASKCPVGASCRDKNNKAGTCPQRPRPCTTACDCIQGEGCINGNCTQGAMPTYCCEKEGCPAGQGCQSKKNVSGICAQACQTPCDCAQGYNCVAGRCNNDPAITSPTYCCSKAGCPTGQYCRDAQNQWGQCPVKACKTACDCNQGEDCLSGQCTQTFPPVYCCSKANCPSGQACKDTGGKWGTCPGGTSCTTNCDCAQGQDCYRGQCIGVHPPVYCCDKANCPSGQACYNKSNQAGYCPTVGCKTACDCQYQGQSCVRGRCVIVTGSARIYCCNKQYCPAGNQCEDTQGNLKLCSAQSCQSPCDCALGEDCRNGVCVNTNPPVYCCSGQYCPSGQACTKSDNTSSRCP